MVFVHTSSLFGVQLDEAKLTADCEQIEGNSAQILDIRTGHLIAASSSHGPQVKSTGDDHDPSPHARPSSARTNRLTPPHAARRTRRGALADAAAMAQRQEREREREEEEEEQRLRGALRNLQLEGGVLERLVYKHRNQHRGAAYFQYLLKVRRDLRLLLGAGLRDVLNVVFPVLASRKPANLILVANRQSKKKPGANHSHHERLLGVARLLSQMAEPVIMGAIQISFLLARSFFVDLCTAVLALLARVRVLIQQMLLDVVSVYNKVTDLIDRKQSVKISIDGVQAFREYYPSSNDVLAFLECVWVKDKFVLHEQTKDYCEKAQDEDQKSCAPKSSIQYETLGLVSEEMGKTEESNSPSKLPDAALSNQPETKTTHFRHGEDSQNRRQSETENSYDSLPDTLATHAHSTPCLDVRPETRKRVAFIAVGNPKVTVCSSETRLPVTNKKKRLDVIPQTTAEPEDLYAQFSEDTDKSIF
ncbi:hypothetical protein GUJ93_ZPchr0009g679 [Zizania palustris]|uniref:Nucleolus and neural progenitor protein-like N-terminal domain-containing protein n=1 Tax=Zizania palustris TaxID=103762 RepID=A0A8J5RM85_ZIZPA|nr:hypothetical protein GUJ93_ZPchr0009g679 [Zizania palustris]